MKILSRVPRLACLALMGTALSYAAEQTAVVKESHVNVRGQPSLAGEVITQLKKGETVTVLEDVSAAKGKTNEPARWARIRMPAKTPVWVSANYIDPTNKTVRVKRLNLRAGPGENYSVIGRLEKGAAVTEIRRVQDWIEIETPPTAYAFVAANLLGPGEAAPEVAQEAPKPAPPVIPPTETPKTEPAQAPQVQTPVQNPLTAAPPPPIPAPTTDQSAAIVPEKKAEPAPAPSEATAANPVAQPVTPPPTPAEASTAPSVAAEAPAAANKSEVQVPRIVRREGIVRSTFSIQAPGYYELLSPENRKTINFLETDKLKLKLKDYRGRRVIVTGSEAIDPRWPNTPLIEVQTLELVP